MKKILFSLPPARDKRAAAMRLEAMSRARPYDLLMDHRGCDIARFGAYCHLQPAPFLLFAAVAASQSPLPQWMIFERIWGNREDGGPDWADNQITVYRSILNKRIAPLGLKLETTYGFGSELVDTQAHARTAAE